MHDIHVLDFIHACTQLQCQSYMYTDYLYVPHIFQSSIFKYISMYIYIYLYIVKRHCFTTCGRPICEARTISVPGLLGTYVVCHLYSILLLATDGRCNPQCSVSMPKSGAGFLPSTGGFSTSKAVIFRISAINRGKTQFDRREP